MNPLIPEWWPTQAYLLMLELQRLDGTHIAAVQSNPDRLVNLDTEFGHMSILPTDFSFGKIWLGPRGWCYGVSTSAGVVVHRGMRTITPLYDESASLEGGEAIGFVRIKQRILVTRIPYEPNVTTDVPAPERRYVPK